MAQLTIDRANVERLVSRAAALASRTAERSGTDAGRAILGIAGAPGAGKSTLAAQVADAVGAAAVVVPMDGYHLAQPELNRLGRAGRKGNIDTFDACGFLSLVRRLASATEDVYVPEYRRELGEPIAGAILVPRGAPLVILEGNYLLVDAPVWREVRPLLTEAWFVEQDEAIRLERLIGRHLLLDFAGRPDAARAHAHGSDQINADLVAGTRGVADVIVVG